MYNRALKPLLNQSFFIFGARGTGKSTLIRDQLGLEGVLEINLLLAEQEDNYRKDPDRLVRVVEAANQEWVFIDEIQKVPRLLDVVHHLIESKKQKFILTGSSARKLKRDGANLLAGRAFVYNLFPLLESELGDDFHLKEALQWGSLPAISSYSTAVEKKTYLRSYVLNYLKEEIRVEQLVRAIDPFRDFLEIAAQCSGKVINFSSIAKQVGVDYKSVQNYFSILEDTLIGFYLPSYSKSVRKSQLKAPKFYLFDLGVKNTLESTIDSVPVESTSSFGHNFEAFLINEIYRLNSYFMTDYKLSYYSTKNGVEVDLVLTKGSHELKLIEIKSSQRVDPAKVSKLSRVAMDFPESREIYYLSNDPTPQTLEDVRCLHWREFLREMWCS